MLKFPASTKQFAVTTAVILFVCFALAATARVGAQDETHQRPRRVTTQPSATPSPQSRQQPQTRAGEEVDENDVVRIETQLVSVPAIVTDASGRPVTGLRADNFQIYEDGRPQKIANFATTEAPFEVALLLDTSGSTRAKIGRAHV